jgi:hypothetical protein
VIVTLTSLAWAPPAPSGVRIRGAVSPSTTLSWNPVDREDAPDLAGYRIYWRLTTSSAWNHASFVGDVAEATLENVIIDNWLFGVSSVTYGGFESPVVFPGAGRSLLRGPVGTLSRPFALKAARRLPFQRARKTREHARKASHTREPCWCVPPAFLKGA